MALKNEEVMNIIVKSLSGDRVNLIDYCTTIMNAEKDGSALKKSIGEVLRKQPRELAKLKLEEKYVFQTLDKKNIEEVFLSGENKEQLNLFFEEYKNKDKFLKYGIPASNKLFLSGAPGNGKTTLANAIATKLDLPFFTFNLSTLFSSYMGQTSERISSVLNKISNINCVLFIDEMDSMLTHRGHSESDIGSTTLENVKIVSALLLEIDRLPSNVILISATNNEKLVDHAVKRRFNYFININEPTFKEKEEYLKIISKKFVDIPVLEIIKEKKEKILKEKNIALIENALMKEIKRYIINKE